MGLATGAALLFTAGCGKQAPPAAEAPNTAAEAAAPATAETQPQNAADAATTGAKQLAGAATNQTDSAMAAADKESQALIEKAQTLVKGRNYQDALTIVQQLSGLQLPPQQRRAVDRLNAQIHHATPRNAAAGGPAPVVSGAGGPLEP